MKRAIIIVLDSLGIGEMPDADKYGDIGSDTLRHIYEGYNEFHLPNMEKLGLGLIDSIDYINVPEEIEGSVARLTEVSPGKDTTTGHWELSGIWLPQAFPTYPNGFPKEVLDDFEKQTGRKAIGNIPISGTTIIDRLGKEHMETGNLIVYTSADSVFQIAAHEEIVPLEDLYKYCEIARRILQGKHGVGRVIARPFLGESRNFKRTDNRKDFSLEPIKPTVMEYIKDTGMEVRAIGKIEDIFLNKGITHSVHTHSNTEGIDQTIEYLKEAKEGLIFTNLVDFDMKYGHRNDISGYGNALIEFDTRLPEILSLMQDDDILFITADHGCDPSTESTDHSREYVPLIIAGKNIKKGINIGTRSTFSDLASTIADYLNVEATIKGESFLKKILGN